LDQREQLQHLRAEQQQLQQHLDQLTVATSGQLDQLTATGQLDDAYLYRVHSSLSESSNGSLSSSSTGYSSSEHGLSYFLLFL